MNKTIFFISVFGDPLCIMDLHQSRPSDRLHGPGRSLVDERGFVHEDGNDKNAHDLDK
jgi:hypothetical protein